MSEEKETPLEEWTVYPANPEVQAICDKLKPEVEKRVNGWLEDFTALVYCDCHLDGATNYYINVHIGRNQYLYLHAKMACDGAEWKMVGMLPNQPAPIKPFRDHESKKS